MAATYEPIQSYTMTDNSNSGITFSSIPSTYTDLRLVIVGTTTSSSNVLVYLNSDTGTNYSRTYIYGNGSTAASGRNSNTGGFNITQFQNFDTTIPTLRTMDIFSYAGGTYKTCLYTESSDLNGSGYTGNLVGLWRNTAAITTLAITTDPTSNKFKTGTTATLYGIKAA